MVTDFSQALKVCITLISGAKEIDEALIKSTVDKIRPIFNLSQEELVTLQDKLENLYSIISDKHRILDDAKPEPWIKNIKSEVKWNFWNRYKLLLESKLYAPDTINKLDDLTDDILDRLVQPGNNNTFDKRGLIVGHVQSGKTGNYIGLICKAADVGYRLIIVLAGIHNSLRSQTQIRIDEGFLGFDTQQARNFNRASNRIGVGKLDPTVPAHSLTTNEIIGDFNRRSSESSGINIRGNDPIILVIKKNASVLRNLLGWLVSRGETMKDGNKKIRNLPLLVIDDEADNASINISKNQVSSINGAIRSLLKIFEQSVYIGYTATPFANIFIPQNEENDVEGLNFNLEKIELNLGKDIFPKDFIINLPAPSNYIGPQQIFGIVSSNNIDKTVQPIPLFRIVNDFQPLPLQGIENPKYFESEIARIRKENRSYIPNFHKQNDARPTELLESIKYAIKCFFISCTVRRARGDGRAHNSMLIHVSRFIRWQDRIADLVLQEVKTYARLVENGDYQFIEELETIWNNEYINTTQQIANNPIHGIIGTQQVQWNDIKRHLHVATSKIEVRAIHGDTKIESLEHKNIRPLDYYDNQENGLSVIAVGGNKLSRGFTLEGLTISYFLRSSKMYDTLMQMGRWFGYKPGYLDLCRLFTSSEMVEWYKHITIATEEMRAEFDRMSDLNKTPAQYGLKVRTHPGVLAITAANKFRYKKIMYLSFSGELEETYSFRKYSDIHISNLNRTINLIKFLGVQTTRVNSEPRFRHHYLWHGKNNWRVVSEYLSGYITDQPSFNVKLITDFIDKQSKNRLVKNWTIALINNSEESEILEITADIRVGLTRRKDDSKDDPNYYMISKSHIIDPRHEYIDLSDSKIRQAIHETKQDAKNKGKDISEIMYPNTLRIKTNRNEEDGLLLIYILNPKPEVDKDAISTSPLVGLAISFPYLENDEKVLYAVNQQFLKEILDYPEELDEQDAAEEFVEEQEDNKTLILDATIKELEDSRKVNFSIFATFYEGTIFANLDVDSNISGSVKERPKRDYKVEGNYISKYQINQPELSAITRISLQEERRGIIVSHKKFRKTAFSIVYDSCQIDDQTLAFDIEDVQSEYVLALLNSVLFSFWVSTKGLANGQTKSLIDSFPIKSTSNGMKGLVYVVKALVYLSCVHPSSQVRVISAYFINVIDAAVLEVYYPADFLSNDMSVLSELEQTGALELEMKSIKEYYDKISSPKSPIKKAVYFQNSVDKFSLMYENITSSAKA